MGICKAMCICVHAHTFRKAEFFQFFNLQCIIFPADRVAMITNDEAITDIHWEETVSKCFFFYFITIIFVAVRGDWEFLNFTGESHITSVIALLGRDIKGWFLHRIWNTHIHMHYCTASQCTYLPVSIYVSAYILVFWPQTWLQWKQYLIK